jgi:hypothetical protein
MEPGELSSRNAEIAEEIQACADTETVTLTLVLWAMRKALLSLVGCTVMMMGRQACCSALPAMEVYVADGDCLS